MRPDILLDNDRLSRIGIDEAVYSETKSDDQLVAIARESVLCGGRRLFTRLAPAQYEVINYELPSRMEYDPVSGTGIVGPPATARNGAKVAVVSAGSSDARVAGEAARTLRYHGQAFIQVHDVGVAGLWRLMSRLDDIAECSAVIVAAGMEGALPTVIAGLLPLPVVAVPCSVGYGVSAGGRVALESALASCAPGVMVVNIDNGYGAACAMLRILPSVAEAKHAAGSGVAHG